MTYSKGKMLSCSFFKSGQLRGLHFEIPVPDVSETLDQNPCPFLRIPADDQNLDFGILPADFSARGAPFRKTEVDSASESIPFGAITETDSMF